jgi:hypothetical protein
MSPLLLAATTAAPAAENREASPIALVVVLILVVALVFLIRSMNRHLRKVPSSFSRSDTRPDAVGQEPVDEQRPQP